MNLIQTPVEIPLAQQILRRHESSAASALNILHITTVTTFREFWKDRETAEALLAEIGTNAVAAFAQHSAAVQFLLASGVTLAPADYVPPFAFTAHQDGTITLDS